METAKIEVTVIRDKVVHMLFVFCPLFSIKIKKKTSQNGIIKVIHMTRCYFEKKNLSEILIYEIADEPCTSHSIGMFSSNESKNLITNTRIKIVLIATT